MVLAPPWFIGTTKERETMATLVYTGGAMDHEVIPGVEMRGEDGRPIKRRYVKMPETTYKEIEKYSLWGLDFPKGEEVEIPQHLISAGIIKKAITLGCFQVDEGSTTEIVADDAAVAKERAEMEPTRVEKSTTARKVRRKARGSRIAAKAAEAETPEE